MATDPSPPVNLPAALRMLASDKPATPPPGDRQQSYVLQTVLEHDPPGSWAGDRYEQTNHCTGMVAVAAKAYLDAVAGAKVRVLERKRPTVKKSAGVGHFTQDEEYEPVEYDHPLRQIIEQPGGPNGVWEFTQELEFLTLQYLLTGDAPVWCPHNDAGKPVRFFALTSALTQPMFGLGVNPVYPQGAYRVIPYSGLSTFYVGGQLASQAVLPAEEVGRLRELHPWGRNIGMSRLQSGAKEVDVLEAITDSRYAMFDHGLQLDTVALLPGVDQETCEGIQKRVEQKAGGARNSRRFLVIGGGAIGEKFDLKTYGQSAREMDYQQSYDQAAGVVLAFFRVPKSAAGLTSATNYSGLFAEKQQLREYGLVPFCFKLSRFASQTLAKPWCEFPGQYKIEIEAPPLGDLEMDEKQFQSDCQTGLLTWNQALRKRNLPSIGPEGDVPASLYVPLLQAKLQPQPAPAGPDAGADGSQPGDETPAEGDQPQDGDDSPEATQDAVTQAALSALGVPADDAPVQKAFDANQVRDAHGRWRAEDEVTDATREAEDDTLSDRHGAEDEATERRHDKERAAHERELQKVHGAEDKALEKVRAKEDQQREKQRDKEQARREKAREKEDERLADADEKERADKGIDRLEKEMFARQQAEDDALVAAHTAAHDAHVADVLAAIKRGELDGPTANDQVGAAREARERELAALRARHGAESDQFADTHATDAGRAIERLEDARNAEDDAVAEREYQEDADVEARRDREDAAREELRSNEDGGLGARHATERDAVDTERFDTSEVTDAARRTEDHTRYHVRRAEHPEAHAVYYGPDDHALHGTVAKAIAPTKPGSSAQPRKARNEGEVWQAHGTWWTKRNGKIIRQPNSTRADQRAAKEMIAARVGAKPGSALQPAPSSASHDVTAKKWLAGRPSLNVLTPDAKGHKITDGASVKAFLAKGGKLPTAVTQEAAKAVPAATPVAQQALATVNQWAKGQADKHADRVAAHFGISRERAHALLLHAITQIAQHAAKTGGKPSGTLTIRDKRSGKTATLAPKKSGPTSGAPPRPANPAAKGSRPPVAKALSVIDDSAGGFLVAPAAVGAPKKKRKRIAACVAHVLKSLEE